ncbi:MAG: hypothetical protein P4N59_03445 [Negativicutes bacterium]|nr:hypothetical protein [Negativicutes bacterium]
MTLPSIIFCDELPEWIVESKFGAYHSFLYKIYIRRRLGLFLTAMVLLHELTHWFICETGLPESCHAFLEDHSEWLRPLLEKKE